MAEKQTFADLLDDLAGSEAIQPDQVHKLKAEDGTELAMGVFRPAPSGPAVMILHGAGAHMTAGYNLLARALKEQHGITVFTPDVRGHGLSSGARGYAARAEHVWRDITLFVEACRQLAPGQPLHLCGHSSGAGLLLNWMTYEKPKPGDAVTLSLLAPFLNLPRAAESGQSVRFSEVRMWIFLLYFFSGKRLAKDWPAVRFAYPEASDSGLVRSYSPGMAVAVSPRHATAQLKALQLETHLLAAEADELFSLAQFAALSGDNLTKHQVPGGHLSCLREAAPKLAQIIFEHR